MREDGFGYRVSGALQRTNQRAPVRFLGQGAAGSDGQRDGAESGGQKHRAPGRSRGKWSSRGRAPRSPSPLRGHENRQKDRPKCQQGEGREGEGEARGGAKDGPTKATARQGKGGTASAAAGGRRARVARAKAGRARVGATWRAGGGSAAAGGAAETGRTPPEQRSATARKRTASRNGRHGRHGRRGGGARPDSSAPGRGVRGRFAMPSTKYTLLTEPPSERSYLSIVMREGAKPREKSMKRELEREDARTRC